MFAFEEWHSALEMKLYLHRFIHQIRGMPDFSTLKFTRYNQYESLVLPLVKWLQDHGVVFQFGTEVTDVDFHIVPGRKQATRIHWRRDDARSRRRSGPRRPGVHDHRLAHREFRRRRSPHTGESQGRACTGMGSVAAHRRQGSRVWAPDVFGAHIPETKWESATVTTLDERIPKYIRKIAKRDPFSGKVVTGGIVTAKDSSWLLSWTVNRQPHFKQQPKEQIVVWVYSLFVERPGDYVKKPMQDCSGEEITQEWLYHLGVRAEDIPVLAATGASTVPVMMPYVTAFFMPRQAGDRPDVVPAGAVNFAFIGQFAESRERDCIFTTEYSVRTAMEAVYTLLGVERGVPEVFNSTYDIRMLLSAIGRLRDGKEIDVPGPAFLRSLLMNKLDKTQIGALLREFGLITDD